MSLDYYVYLKRKMPNKSAFEEYAKELGFELNVHPKIDFMTDTGFCPICLTDVRFGNENESNAFLTGFEIYHDDFHPSKPNTSGSKGIWGLFQKKVQIKETPFDLAVKDSSLVLSLSCSGIDSFEILMAYIFGAYCVKHCNAVFDDPQYGCFYNDAAIIESEISRIVEELVDIKESGDLHVHLFEAWI